MSKESESKTEERVSTKTAAETFVDPPMKFPEQATNDKGEKVGELEKPAETEQKVDEDKPKATFSDYLEAKGIDVKKAAVETKSAEEIREEAKKGQAASQKTVESRILDDIDESHRGIFKSMSNEAFNTLKPVYLEAKQLREQTKQLNAQLVEAKKSNLPASYYSHPQAYQLSPEYTQLSVNADAADMVMEHWALQSAKIRRGEKWQAAVGFDKEGNLTLSEEKDADASSEAYVGKMFTAAQEQLFDHKKKLTSFVDNFGTKYKEDSSMMDEAYKKYFPDYDNPKHHTRQLQDGILEMLPVSFKDNVPTKLFLATAANNAILMGKLKEALSQIDKFKGIKTDSTNAGPTKGETVNGTPGGARTVTWADYQKRKAGLE